MAELSGKRILITGAASGIGREAARIAVAEGSTVAGVSRRKDRLEELTDELGGRFVPLALDLESPSCVGELAALDKFDALICNAGRGCTRMPLDVDFPLVEEMMRANVLTVVNTLDGCLPKMRQARNGSIVVIGSVLARTPYAPWRAAYSASKAALGALVSGWRQQLVLENISVKFVCPGLTQTEFQEAANPEALPLPQLNTRVPMISQTAEEVARIIVDSIFADKDEIYTRPEMAVRVASHYKSLSEGRDGTRDVLKV